MCGISGYISSNKNFNSEQLKKSLQKIRHRGPDNQGVWINNNVGLGHRRLSIIDLSDDANQPMHSNSGRYTAVFNGEIYNFKEIAQKFELNLRTSSDTEVIVEAFEKQGVNIVNEFNGMFCLAVFDKETDKLFLFRDRLGIKPLFYYYDGENFAFASELKALLEFNFIKNNTKLNKNSISLFLQYGYIPEPETIFNNIKKFPSGNYAIYHNNKLEITNYWSIESKITKNTISNFTTAKNKLNELLVESVKLRMISDVPLGTFLSGGIDSSLVTAVAQSISKKPVKTFSIGFTESKFNESAYAAKVAKHLKTDHHEFIVSEKDVLELIDDYFDIYDEPFADSSGFPTMLVSKMARKHVTVVLSGDGGDELFHGYGAYIWANRLNNNLINTFRKPIGFTLSHLNDKYKRAAKLFQYPDKQHIKTHIFSQEQYFFSANELKKLLINNKISTVTENFNLSRSLTPSEEQSIFDLKYYLKDDLLTKVDRASMHYALETRVPLLDHNIVEFALNTNPALKIKNKEQKHLLKQVLYDYVPAQYFDRPKWGFSIPLSKWLKTDLSYLIDKYLSKELVETANIVNYSEVKSLIKKFNNGQSFLYNRLWVLIVLHRWIDEWFLE